MVTASKSKAKVTPKKVVSKKKVVAVEQNLAVSDVGAYLFGEQWDKEDTHDLVNTPQGPARVSISHGLLYVDNSLVTLKTQVTALIEAVTPFLPTDLVIPKVEAYSDADDIHSPMSNTLVKLGDELAKLSNVIHVASSNLY